MILIKHTVIGGGDYAILQLDHDSEGNFNQNMATFDEKKV